MEKIKLEVAKIVGTPSPTSWSQAHTFFPEDSEKLEKRGKLLAVISLQAVESGMETVALGREILARLHEEYYGDLEGGILQKLKSSLEKIKSEWPKTEVVAGIVFSPNGINVFYLGILGKGKALFKRGNLLQNILVGTQEDQVETGSGLIEKNDVLLLGSSSFFEAVSEGVLKASLSLGNPQEMVESIAPIVLSRADLAQAAAVICSFLPEELPEEIPPFVPEEPPKTEVEAAFPPKSFKKFFSSLFSKLKPKLNFPKFPKRSFYIRRERVEKGRNKTIISVAIILIFLFLGSLVLGAGRKRRVEKENKIKILFSQAEEKLNQARETIQLDSDSARANLEEALQFLKEAKRLNPKKAEDIDFLQTEAEKLLAKTKKDFDLGELAAFFDLELLKEQAKATAIALKGKDLVILDSGNKSLYWLDLEKKSSVIFSDEKLAKSQRICLDGQAVYILGEEGIFQTNTKEKKISLTIPKDQMWGRIVWLSSFAGNLYFLDADKKMIWQYPQIETGFGALRNWLSSGTKIEAEPYSMMIDASIWTLDKEGKISKYTRGLKDKFEFKGYQKDLSGIKAFYLSEEEQNIYLLDPQAKKVVIFGKDGQFKVEYHWSGRPENPQLIEVWEAQKKAYLIKDNLIFSFGINESLQ